MPVVEVENLIKDFGAYRALQGVSFSVDEGVVFGLVGPNGAGKTTTFRIIAGLLPPTSGEVSVLGMEPGDVKLRRLMAYLPEDAGAYRNITGYEFLALIARLYFGRSREAEEALELGLKIANLGDKVHDKMKNYSKGMKRRIQVARALMVKPKVLVLDEPTAGLDVVNAKEIRDLIVQYAQTLGTTVLVSSHNMTEVEKVCSTVALINRGLILEQGYVSELLSKHGVKDLEDLFLKLVGSDSRW
ncbi:MAG: ABC transporter ATP-binding protein [Thermofilaceae archaeon]